MTTAAAKRQAAKSEVCEHLSIADLCGECIAKAVRRAGVDDAPASDPRVEQYIRQENSRRGIW